MNIKGTSIRATNNFVEKKFPDRYKLWLESLPYESRKIFEQTPVITKWYPFIEGMKIPTEVISKLFYNGDTEKAAYEIGLFSADEALHGIYKIFIKITNPKFILKKLPTIFSTYYDFGQTEIQEIKKNSGIYRIKFLPLETKILIPRIKGWAEQTLYIIRHKPVMLTYKIIENENFLEAIYNVIWE